MSAAACAPPRLVQHRLHHEARGGSSRGARSANAPPYFEEGFCFRCCPPIHVQRSLRPMTRAFRLRHSPCTQGRATFARAAPFLHTPTPRVGGGGHQERREEVGCDHREARRRDPNPWRGRSQGRVACHHWAELAHGANHGVRRRGDSRAWH